MTEVGKIWNELSWFAHDRSEWQSLSVSVHIKLRGMRDADDICESKNSQRVNDYSIGNS